MLESYIFSENMCPEYHFQLIKKKVRKKIVKYIKIGMFTRKYQAISLVLPHFTNSLKNIFFKIK